MRGVRQAQMLGGAWRAFFFYPIISRLSNSEAQAG